ncbi:OLC1v1003389C3 [Oldenlandia corymbosa var. corymbosa]|uniref:OLC1v1003389C3 n=1 Tax=Oldenlandia corymbosa var. corymbosa TaxID=529605 RepID=A0AAV1DAK4_OLDCO|nr:OLC1v1003389C3 [Oldenlandia corymbosa var. corymbosa]
MLSSEDHISALPCDILIRILSLLTPQEAGRTSVLSKRWKGLWTFVVELDFDCKVSSFGCRIFEDQRRRYVEWVNQVVQSHKGLEINKFRICFELDRNLQNDIDGWLRYAFARKVKSLELDFLIVGSPFFLVQEPYRMIPTCLLDPCSEKSLEDSPSSAFEQSIHTLELTGFKYLKSLRLAGVDVTGEDFKLFLHVFPSLERLVVCGSRSQDLLGVVVTGSSLALKYLEITYCEHLESIIIRDAYLVSLNITLVTNLLIENVPMLVDVCVSGWLVREIIPQLPSCLSRVEVLTIHFADADVKEVENTRVVEVPQKKSKSNFLRTAVASSDIFSPEIVESNKAGYKIWSTFLVDESRKMVTPLYTIEEDPNQKAALRCNPCMVPPRSKIKEDVFSARDCQTPHWMIVTKFFFRLAQQFLE